MPAPQRPSATPLLVSGILGIVLGCAVSLVGVVIGFLPMALFLVGGGGNTDAFEDFARPFRTTGTVVGLIGIGILLLAIVLTVVAARRRRRSSRPGHPYR